MLLSLYVAFLLIGLASFGGGYVAIPLIQSEIVEKNGWITLEDFSNLVSIAEITPGPLAINSATFVGMKMGGILGGIVATLGVVTPSLSIVMLLAFFYTRFGSIEIVQNILKFVRQSVIVLILSAGIVFLFNAILKVENKSLTLNNIEIKSFLIFLFCFIISYFSKISPILIILISGLAGIVLYHP